MEKIARIFFVFTLLFAAAFIVFFLLYAQAKNEIAQSKIDKAGLQQSVSTMNNDMNRQRVIYEELERKYRILEANASETSQVNIQKLKDQIYDQQKHIEELEASVKEKDETILSFKTEGVPITSPSTSTSAQVEQIAQVAAEYEKEIKRLQTELASQKEETQSLSEQLKAKDTDQRVKDLQARIDQTQSELSAAISRTQKLEDQLAQKTKDLDDLQEQFAQANESTKVIGQKQAEIKKLEQSLAQSSDELTNKSTVIAQKDKDITNLNARLNEAETKIKTLETTLNRERKYDPIPSGEADAVKYKYLLLGEDALSSDEAVKSADYFLRAELDELALGDLHKIYSRKRELAFQKAIAQHYNQGYEHYKNKDYARAIEAFKKAERLSIYVATSYSDDTLYYKGLSAYNLKLYDGAQGTLNTLIATQKNSTYIPHSLYYLAKIYEELNNREQLLKTAKELSNYSQYSTYAKKIIESMK